MRKRKSGPRPRFNVVGLSLVELVRLRDALNTEVVRRRAVAEQQVQQLDRMAGGARQAFTGPRLVIAKGNKLSPKYRNPKTGQTWAGRGATPKWMRAALKAGAKRDQFLIKKVA